MPTQENGDIESAKTAKDYKLPTEEPVQAMEVDAAKVVVYKRLPCETVSRMLVNHHGIIFACGLLLIFILSISS